MSEPNFTKGPWHTHKRFMDKQKTWMRISIQSNEPPPQSLIAEMPDPTYCNPKGCAESEVINANAALISAAPEMYENEKSNVDMLARCENLLRGISEMSYLTDGFQDHAFYREWADEIREYIKKTNSLLAKARGEGKE